MKEKKEYMEVVYEQFSQDIIPTEEMKKIYKKFSDKIQFLKEKADKEIVKDIDSLEDIFSTLASLEVKQGFLKGFSVAMNITRENFD